MIDYVGVSGVLFVGAFFCWLGYRAWHAERRLLKWIGTPLAGLFAIISIAILVAALAGYWKLNKKYDNPVSTISVDVTAERIARGERFAILCAGCHGANEELPLSGRDFLSGDDAPPIGEVYASNLTPTHLGSWSDGEIIRAIREGIHKDGRSLLIMPASMFRFLSDDDVADIVAYLRAQEAVEPDTPRRRLNILGAVMVNLAPVFQAQVAITEPVVAPKAGVTSAYGEYLTAIMCVGCHGEDLGGDVNFDVPTLMAAGLAWSEEDFLEFFNTGVNPGGRAVDAENMPWLELREFFVDDEIRAVFLHLQKKFSPAGE